MRRNLRAIQRLASIIGLAALCALAAFPLSKKAEALAQSPAKVELPTELQYVPVDSALFLSLHAVQVLDHPILKSFRKADPKTFEELIAAAKMAFGFTPEDVKSVALFLPKIHRTDQPDGFGVAFTFRNAYDKQKIASGAKELLPKNTKINVVSLTDRKALVLVNLGEEFAKPQASDKSGPLTNALQAAATGKHAIVLGITPANLPEILRADDPPEQIRPFQPLFKSIAISATLDLGKSLDFDVRVKTATARQAAECEKSLATLLGLLQENVGEELKEVAIDPGKKPYSKDFAAILKAASTAIDKASYSTLGNETQLTLSLKSDLPFNGVYFAAKDRIESEKAIRASSENLQQIGYGTISYADTMNGNLPPAAVCDKTGKKLLSWRVLILPYIEQEALFREFKLDEPWDSDHNKKLLAKMPKVYSLPGKNKPGATDTYYRVFVGNGAGFEWFKGARFPADFPDGTSNTMMCVIARDAVPWTKPEELEFDPEKDMRKLLGTVGGKLQAGMFDGSSHTFKKIPSKETIHAAITRAGGEVLGEDFE
jgi:hypothetical protein